MKTLCIRGDKGFYMKTIKNFSAAITCIVLALLVISCSTVVSSTADKDVSYAVKALGGTPLGEMAATLAAGKADNESGFLLLDRGHNALAWRLFMADQATKTIDAEYFLWKNDHVGRLFIQRLLDAAERGVRVRVIIDDSMTESDPVYLAKFGAHPNVEVRLYKPFGPASKSYVFRWLDFAADFKLMNRRMHNKLYIADDSIMISGGRNIGDDYFEYLAPDVFRSRDLMGVGQIADAGSDAFDMFWNSVWTVPIEMVVDPAITADEAESFRQTLDTEGEDASNYPPGYAEVGSIADAQARLAAELLWGEYRLIYDTVPGDDGEPLVPKDATNTVGITLRKAADNAEQDIVIESAYLILTDSTIEHMGTTLDRGVKIYALTNSLSANNHTTAFVGYRKQRKKMIEHLTGLYEYRADAKNQTELYNELAPGEPVPHMGLHAKTAVFDRKIVFIGSFNLDPRSENLNTEIGILVKSEELGALVADSILGDSSPGNSWLLRLDDRGNTEWVTIEADGTEYVEPNDEPLSSSGRMIEADLAQPFTPKAQM
jgi:putative cardiolipin synthase